MVRVEGVQAAFPPSQGPYLYGQVDLAADAVVAATAILGAAPGCRLVIAAGVCLGRDVVVQACRGDLVIEAGVNLGSGALVVGRGRIGPGACIGANSTLIDPSLHRHQVVPPQSLLGDPSGEPHPSGGDPDGAWSPRSPEPGQGSPSSPDPTPEAIAAVADLAPPPPNGTAIHGKKQVEQLLATLFPHRRSLNGLSPENRP
ncbi:MAG TPA: hypothetical protein IGR64_12885 [Leptolyngbyaceae cyanobacterium M65_K2018_010]|nr:hypothetical protein [Leptolyngbyaceae cyanobacterium M65_K2018_010]